MAGHRDDGGSRKTGFYGGQTGFYGGKTGYFGEILLWIESYKKGLFIDFILIIMFMPGVGPSSVNSHDSLVSMASFQASVSMSDEALHYRLCDIYYTM